MRPDQRMRARHPRTRRRPGVTWRFEPTAVHVTLRAARASAACAAQCARDDFRVAEIAAHERFDALLGRGAWDVQSIRHDFLERMAEHVHVSPGVEVQHRSHPEQEAFRLVDPVLVHQCRRRIV